jgi:hypothetical protein
MTTSFQADIRPLFTERDIQEMIKGFNLAMTAFVELVAPSCRRRPNDGRCWWQTSRMSPDGTERT